jgi:lipopolysaccharide/colanic/teichoic acid biosynthesis glycosyltransferase
MSRILEVIIVVVLLLLLSPLLILLALAVVIDSPGPPFFRQRRVGIHGTYFWMYKFRKMRNSIPPDGKGITTRNDVRLTRMGKILERFKLDELPQLLNVLKGDMALIGPRPEIPRFTVYYPEKWQEVLKVRPGVIGYSQMIVPHESDLYPPDCVDHEAYYIEHILPDKLDNEIRYTQLRSFALDIQILFQVTCSLLTKTINRQWILVRLSHVFMFLMDSLISVVSLLVSLFLVYQNGIPPAVYALMDKVLMVGLLVRPVIFILSGLHRYPISSSITLSYLLRIARASFYSSLALIMTLMFLDERDLVLSAHLVDLFVLPVFLIGVRIGYIFLHDSILKMGSLVSPSRALVHAVIILGHGIAGFLSFWIAHILWMQELNMNYLIPRIGIVSLLALGIRLLLSVVIWPPQGKTWRSLCIREGIKILNVSLMGTGFILISYLVMQQETYSRVALILDFCLYSLTAFMFALIWCMPQIGNYQRDKSKKVIILGVGVEAEHLISTLQRLEDDSLNVVGIVTDIEWKRFSSIAGVNVIGNVADLSAILKSIVRIFWCPGNGSASPNIMGTL